MTDTENNRNAEVIADLEKVIEHYRNDYGRRPSSAEEIAQYPKSIREEIERRLRKADLWRD